DRPGDADRARKHEPAIEAEKCCRAQAQRYSVENARAHVEQSASGEREQIGADRDDDGRAQSDQIMSSGTWRNAPIAVAAPYGCTDLRARLGLELQNRLARIGGSWRHGTRRGEHSDTNRAYWSRFPDASGRARNCRWMTAAVRPTATNRLRSRAT